MTTTVLSGSTQVVLAKIDGNNPTTAFGTGSVDWAVEDAYQPTRTVLKIDTSGIPSSDTVSAVTFSITGVGGTNSTYTVDFLKLLADPTLSEVTWNNRNTATAWNAGGAFNSTDAVLTPAFSIASFSISGSNSNTSAGLISLFNDWVQNPSNNKGLLIKMAIDSTYSGAYLTFSRPTITITHAASGGAPTVTTVSSNSATEASTIVHTVTLSGATSGSTNYAATLVGVTATGSGTDFTSDLASASYSNGVTFSGGNMVVPTAVSSWTVTISTASDTIDEANETYTLTIGGTAGTGTINDDDAAPVITVGDAPSVTAGSPAIFTVNLDRPKSSAITCDATCLNGTLTGGVGYTSDLSLATISNGVTFGAGALTIPAGVTSFTVSIPTAA